MLSVKWEGENYFLYILSVKKKIGSLNRKKKEGRRENFAMVIQVYIYHKSQDEWTEKET